MCTDHEEGWNYIEDKAKVVASVWGTKFVQLIAALAALP